MSEPVLDIIVTWHNEPFYIVKPFFDMLAMQQCVDFSDVRVILIDNNKDISYSISLEHYPYSILHTYIDDDATAADARNAGLMTATAPWVMFCNADDMFSDVCSLSMYLENIPTEDYDIIWSKMVQQTRWFNGSSYFNRVDCVNFSNTDGKMYRRQFLLDHDVWFTNDIPYWYDYIFNSIALSEMAPFRIAALTTEFYPYYKRFRSDASRHTWPAAEEMLSLSLKRDVYLIEEYKLRNCTIQYRNAIARAFARQYYDIYDPHVCSNSKLYFSPSQIDLCEQFGEEFTKLSEVDMEPVLADVETEVVNTIQNLYNEHNKEYYLVNDSRSFSDWFNELLDQMVNRKFSAGKQNSDTFTPVPDVSCDDTVKAEESTEPEHDPRVVVYCGTYDVYLNMLASVKSLLATTPVDKVYFLIEDDVFPYDLPDCVECINVKNQTFFPKNGPNYNNSWTYMCMMRAIYPILFTQYDKILSLDIDVVINDDVSDLWDYDLTDYYLAGVPEPQRRKSTSDPLYINFGVVMMNLEKLRKDRKADEIISLLNTTKIDCPEQGAFNRACAYHILELPADYNYTAYSHITGDAERQRIIHYAGQKFWRCYKSVKQYSELSWNDIMERQAKLHE